MNWYHFRSSAHFNPVRGFTIRNRTSDRLKWRTACDGHSSHTHTHGCSHAIVLNPAGKLRSFWTKCPATWACSCSRFHYWRTWKCLITMKKKKKIPKTNKYGVASLKTMITHYTWIKFASVTLARSGKLSDFYRISGLMGWRCCAGRIAAKILPFMIGSAWWAACCLGSIRVWIAGEGKRVQDTVLENAR